MATRTSPPSLFPGDALNDSPTIASSDWVSAHCDGGARGNPGPAGYGVLVQDKTGAVLAELSEYLGLRTNNFAEYSGLLGSLDFAIANGYRKLRVVSDSELMVKQIQGKYQVKSPDLRPLFDAAKKKIAQLEGFEISHALRHKNKDADRLANEAMDRGTKRVPANTLAMPQPAEARPSPARGALPHKVAAPSAGTMLRGFVKDGTVRILGSAILPDGTFVKIIPE